MVIFLLSKELALTPKASPDDKLVAFDDSQGEASDLRTSCTCEARAECHSTVGIYRQLLWAEDPTFAGRRGPDTSLWKLSVLASRQKILPVSRTFGSRGEHFSEARSKLQLEEPFLFFF